MPPTAKAYDLTKDRAFIALKREVDALKRQVETLKREASAGTGRDRSIVETISHNVDMLTRWRTERMRADRALDRRIDVLERARAG